MSDQNNTRTMQGLRDMITAKAAETTLSDSQYDYGHVNGWLGALHWADLIDLVALDDLRSLAKVEFEKAVIHLNAS